MRLIDAELFKKQVAAMTIRNGYIPEKANALCELIDSQPTAFDLDNVVGKLEKEESKARLQLIEARKTAFEFSSKCRLDAYKKSIGIVKGGGVE